MSDTCDEGDLNRKLIADARANFLFETGESDLPRETDITPNDPSSGTPGQDESNTLEFVEKADSQKVARPVVEKAFGDYEVLSILGRGGMGIVYEARHRKLDRIVALKMIRSGVFADERELVRFQNEVDAVASLDHPNIVQVLEFGEVGTTKYFTMKYVRGGTLSQKVSELTANPRATAQLMIPIARALHHAHQRGILHRDLKPANILLDEQSVPYVTDFGLARRIDGKSAMTATGEALGTPSYMAPEQAAGRIRDIGTATDVYGLGGILYAMLTKQAPFQGESVLDTLELVKHSSVKPPTALNPGVPRDLEVICLKCLQHDPHRRYDSANALAVDLENFLEGRPLNARPVGNAAKLCLWARRNPLIATLSSTAGLLALVTAIVASSSAWTLSVKNREIGRQNQEILERNSEVTRQRDLAEENAELAERSASLAEERAGLALGAYQTLISEAENRLSELAGSDDIRRDILLLAAEGLRKLAAEMNKSSKADPTLAAALVKLADDLRESGNSTEAMQLCREAYQLLKERPSLQGDSIESRFNVAQILTRLGALTGRIERNFEEARTYYAEAIRRLESLLEMRAQFSGEITPYRVITALIDARQRLAALCLRLGDFDGCIDQSNRIDSLCEAEIEKLRDQVDSTDPQLIDELQSVRAFQLSTLAQALVKADRMGEATSTFAAASQQTTELLANVAAKKATYIQREANIDVAHGWHMLVTGQHQRAIDLLKHAVSRYEWFHQKLPNNVEFANLLSLAHYRLGIAYTTAGDPAIARLQFEACRTLRQKIYDSEQSIAQWAKTLALVLARLGDTEKALELAEQLESTDNLDAELKIDLARIYALCSCELGSPDQDPASQTNNRSELQHQALEHLRSAIDDGFKDIVSIRDEPDLACLRNRPTFQALINR